MKSYIFWSSSSSDDDSGRDRDWFDFFSFSSFEIEQLTQSSSSQRSSFGSSNPSKLNLTDNLWNKFNQSSSKDQPNSNIVLPKTDYRCKVIFKFFWGGTWGCEKIQRGVFYLCVLLNFYNKDFWSLLKKYVHEVPPSPLVRVYEFNLR